MTRDFALWKHQVQQAVAGLLGLNDRAGAADAGDCSAFRQAMATLYAEGHFAGFVAYQGWRQAGLNAAAGQALYDLQAQLDDYDEPDSDTAILADPAWHAILKRARQVVALLGPTDKE